MAQGTLQPSQPASVLHGFDGIHRRLEHGAEVVPHDAVPLATDPADHAHVVLDLFQVADSGQPAAVGNALVEHGRVHHQQSRDSAAVGLAPALVVLQVVQAKVPVQGWLEAVVPHVVSGFPDAGFQYVQVPDHAVIHQAGLGKEVHRDGFSLVF